VVAWAGRWQAHILTPGQEPRAIEQLPKSQAVLSRFLFGDLGKSRRRRLARALLAGCNRWEAVKGDRKPAVHACCSGLTRPHGLSAVWLSNRHAYGSGTPSPFIHHSQFYCLLLSNNNLSLVYGIVNLL